MLQVKLTELKKGRGCGMLTGRVADKKSFIPGQMVPGELGKYVSDNSGIEERDYGDYCGGSNAFDKLSLSDYYLLSEEELTNLCQKAFSGEIAAKVFEEATQKGG